MRLVSPYAFVLTATVSAVLLAGCAPTAAPSSSGDTGSTETDTGSDAPAGADCGIYADQTDPELTLFTSSTIAAGPSEGQVYGDGTELSVTLSAEAIAAGYLPQFEILTLSETGGPVLVTSTIFDPTTGSDGTYSTSALEFGNDELVGTAVVAEIFAIDTAIADAVQYGDKVLLGNYCLTYANDGS